MSTIPGLGAETNGIARATSHSYYSSLSARIYQVVKQRTGASVAPTDMNNPVSGALSSGREPRGDFMSLARTGAINPPPQVRANRPFPHCPEVYVAPHEG